MARERDAVTWLSLAGVLGPVWLVGGSFALGASRPGYDPLRDAISELGERGASTSLLWNAGGFFIVGILFALYAVAVRAEFRFGWLLVLTVLQAGLLASAANLPCDPGCPPVPETSTMLGHIVVGLGFFAITCLLPIVAWATFRSRSGWESYAKPSLAVGVVLVGLFILGPTLGPDRVGAWQRVTLIVAFSWQIAVALRLYRARSSKLGLDRAAVAPRPGRP